MYVHVTKKEQIRVVSDKALKNSSFDVATEMFRCMLISNAYINMDFDEAYTSK